MNVCVHRLNLHLYCIIFHGENFPLYVVLYYYILYSFSTEYCNLQSGLHRNKSFATNTSIFQSLTPTYNSEYVQIPISISKMLVPLTRVGLPSLSSLSLGLAEFSSSPYEVRRPCKESCCLRITVHGTKNPKHEIISPALF